MWAVRTCWKGTSVHERMLLPGWKLSLTQSAASLVLWDWITCPWESNCPLTCLHVQQQPYMNANAYNSMWMVRPTVLSWWLRKVSGGSGYKWKRLSIINKSAILYFISKGKADGKHTLAFFDLIPDITDATLLLFKQTAEFITGRGKEITLNAQH